MVAAGRRVGGLCASEGSRCWHFGIGWEIGDLEHNEKCSRTLAKLGQNVAWLSKIHAVPEPTYAASDNENGAITFFL
jgi:hypothetical protein